MLEMFVLNPGGKKLRARRRRKASAWSKLVKKHGVMGAKKALRKMSRKTRKVRKARRTRAWMLGKSARRKARRRTIRRSRRASRSRAAKLSVYRKLLPKNIYKQALKYRLLTNKRKKSRRRKSRRFKDNGRRKNMAVRSRRRKAGRRRYRRNSWPRQSKDHAVAAKLGWAYQERRRKRKRGSPRSYIIKNLGKRKLQMFRARHKVSKRRKSARRMLSFRMPIFGRSYRLVANKRRRSRRSRRRYMDNGRRRVRRGKGGRFVSSKRRRGSRRRYANNFYPFNDNKPRRRRRKSSRRRRRSYKRNWFVYNDNKRSRRSRRRRYSDNGRRRYMRNNAVADVLDTVKSVFDVSFLKDTALPVVGGFFAARAISGFAGAGLLGANYTGWTAHLGNLVAAGLAGAVAGLVTKNPQLSGNVVLGGVVNAVTNIIRDLAAQYGGSIVGSSPVLKTALGLSGMGDNLRSQVEAEVMRELGVGDFLTAQQLSRSERVGDFLTSQQLSQSERIGQYPAETSGIAQYPAETSGGGVSDFADVASFG